MEKLYCVINNTSAAHGTPSILEVVVLTDGRKYLTVGLPGDTFPVYKVDKNDLREVGNKYGYAQIFYRTKEEAEDVLFLSMNKYAISEAVRLASASQLKRIADILGYEAL